MVKKLTSVVTSVLILLTLCISIVPEASAATPKAVNALATGWSHSVALKADGTVWVWGSNEFGQIGNGENGTNNGKSSDYYAQSGNTLGSKELIVTEPHNVLSDAVTVSAGSFHCAAIKSDGTLWMWGSNEYGQIGNGESGLGIVSNVPVKVMDDVIAVSLGYKNSTAIKSDGTLWIWGESPYRGSAILSDKPMKVADKTIAVAAGRASIYYITDDKTLWGFGSNQYGTLPYEENKDTPMENPVRILDRVVNVESSNFQAIALDENGDVWAWGDNKQGVAGEAPERAFTPNKILGSARAIYSTEASNLIILNDNTLWSIGRRLTSNNSKVPLSVWKKPVQIMTNISDAAGHGGIHLTMDMDGIVYVWGDNTYNRISSSREKYISELDKVEVLTDGMVNTSTPIDLSQFDQPSAWASEYVGKAIAANTVPLELRNNYQSPITRIEFAKIIARMIEVYSGKDLQAYVWHVEEQLSRQNKTPLTKVYFSDTTDDDVRLLAQLGVIGGSDSLFSPNGTFTREQAATLLANVGRYFELSDKDGDKEFSDASEFASWSAGGISYASAHGFMGYTDSEAGTFSPKATYSRQESIISVYLLLEALSE